MSIKLQPVSDETKKAFEQWQLLVKMLRKSDAMISVAISRVNRANRLRTMAPKVAMGKQAAILAKAAEYETKGHVHLAVAPGFHHYFKDELVKVREQIEGGIGNE